MLSLLNCSSGKATDGVFRCADFDAEFYLFPDAYLGGVRTPCNGGSALRECRRRRHHGQHQNSQGRFSACGNIRAFSLHSHLLCWYLSFPPAMAERVFKITDAAFVLFAVRFPYRFGRCVHPDVFPGFVVAHQHHAQVRDILFGRVVYADCLSWCVFAGHDPAERVAVRGVDENPTSRNTMAFFFSTPKGIPWLR